MRINAEAMAFLLLLHVPGVTRNWMILAVSFPDESSNILKCS